MSSFYDWVDFILKSTIKVKDADFSPRKTNRNECEKPVGKSK